MLHSWCFIKPSIHVILAFKTTVRRMKLLSLLPKGNAYRFTHKVNHANVFELIRKADECAECQAAADGYTPEQCKVRHHENLTMHTRLTSLSSRPTQHKQSAIKQEKPVASVKTKSKNPDLEATSVAQTKAKNQGTQEAVRKLKQSGEEDASDQVLYSLAHKATCLC